MTAPTTILSYGRPAGDGCLERYSDFVSDSNVCNSSPWAMIVWSVGELGKILTIVLTMCLRNSEMSGPKFRLS